MKVSLHKEIDREEDGQRGIEDREERSLQKSPRQSTLSRIQVGTGDSLEYLQIWRYSIRL